MKRRGWIAIALCAALHMSSTAWGDDQELAKKLSNPVSDLVSVPFQFNWEFGNGPGEDTWEVTNLQPVVPFRITEHTHMIARLIVPTISMPGETVDGDMVFSLFFSPARSSVIW